jgi:hypothetical protein
MLGFDIEETNHGVDSIAAQWQHLKNELMVK